MRTKLSTLALMSAVVAMGYAGIASSATLNLSYSTTFNGTSVVTTPTPGTGFVNGPGVPSSSTYSHTFTAPTAVIPGTPSPGYGFYHDYLFTISGAVANSITTTINLSNLLQINNLQERLFKLAGNSIPTLGSPVGGVIDAWTKPIGTSGTVTVLPTTLLNPGTYVLQIRGNVVGSAGGSYTGALNVAPVPLPAALPLLLSGLVTFGTFAMRRRKKESLAA